VLKVQERTEVPEPPVTVVGVSVQAALSAVSATSLANPFRGPMLMVEVPGDPMDAVTAVGLAEIVKSGNPVTVKVTSTELVSEPLVPVTITVTVPAEVKVQDSVEVPEPPVTVAGESVHAELSDTRATSAVNPLTSATVMVEVPGLPVATVTDVGLAVSVKFWTVYVMLMVGVRPLLVP